LLIINSNLSMPFKFLPGMCHPTTEAPKSLNNSQFKKRKEKFESPQQYQLPPLPMNFKFP
jgi:hypothetical protein